MSRSHFLDHLRDYLPNHERAAFRASYGFKSVSTGLSVVLSGVNPTIAAATALSLRRFRPKTVAQMALYQLAGRRARQLGLEIDRARALDRRQMRAAELDQLALQRVARTSHVVRLHHSLDLLAHFLVRHAEHRDVSNVRMGDQHVLGLLRVDVHPARDDHVGLSVGEIEVAVLVEIADVAERRPAA